MKTHHLLLLFFYFFLSQNILPQQDSAQYKNTPWSNHWEYDYKNVAKISLTALAFSNISLSYERSFRPRWTISLNAGYKFSGGTTNLLGMDSTSISISTAGIKGFSVTPELRYYIKSCENQSPNGFYAGIYLRYVHYQSEAFFNHYPNYPDKDVVDYFTSDIRLDQYGAGLMIGYQLLIKNRFIFDFIILGPRTSRVQMIYKFDNNVTDEFLSDLQSNLQQIVDRYGLDYQVEVSQSNSREVRYSFGFTDIRFSISIGYAF